MNGVVAGFTAVTYFDGRTARREHPVGRTMLIGVSTIKCTETSAQIACVGEQLVLEFSRRACGDRALVDCTR